MQDEKKNYKSTLNLPQTTFPMEAKLVHNEPVRLAMWKESHLYERILAARAGGPRWVLHDGPPFANGDIHIGHVINKTLKDVILRFRTMQGFETPYVPGWDCHGLPIEHKIQQDLGSKLRQMSTVEVRQRCHAYAQKYADLQSDQFQRLGILGEWGNPYLTMRSDYEAETLEVFARFVEAGLVYKQLKPVHWSISNQTALADAELEYKDVTDTSVFVEFPAMFLDSCMKGAGLQGNEKTFLLVWTTTPWTLPANEAIAVNPAVSYALVKYLKGGEERYGVVAEALAQRVFARPGVERFEVIHVVPGEHLVQSSVVYRHPFIEFKRSNLVAADYVTTTDGTGLVHTAPGHGEEDYVTGVANGLPVYCPVLPNGKFDGTVPEWLRGLSVWDANPVIVKRLRDDGLLLADEPITHSYPHDWRSQTPTIFRATEQWFVKMDHPFEPPAGTPAELVAPLGPDGEGRVPSLRFAAERACMEMIGFVPKWGQARLLGMLKSRPDWCISRQRAWGLPIPVFYNEQNEPLLTPESVRAVAKHFRVKGSDAWFTDSPSELLGCEFQCPPEFGDVGKLRKEKDIFDVWFESGSSWHAVLQARSYLNFPADLYLEGSDQHRGWFQLSLLPSLGATGTPPFKQVLTHGFAVKPDGTKWSKRDQDSNSEYPHALKLMNELGADLLRLWCCSMDYQGDMPASREGVRTFGDKYRKIRNTLRYLVSNVYDFNPATDAQPVPQNSFDGWAMHELDTLIGDATAAYDTYQLHVVFRLLHDFCAVQVSALYGNAMKDRLYCEPPNSPVRRRCQTVMHRMLLALTKLLAPMLVFTADEMWEHIPHKPGDESTMPSVHLALLPKPSGETVSDAHREEWALLMRLRDEALSQLDKLTRQIGKYKALDAEIIYELPDDLRRRLEPYGADLEDLVGAGCHSFAPSADGKPSVNLVDRRDAYKACARSWKRRADVGSDAQHADLSVRDAAAMRAAGA